MQPLRKFAALLMATLTAQALALAGHAAAEPAELAPTTLQAVATVDYSYTTEAATIRTETFSNSSTQGIGSVADLRASHQQHQITPQVQLGVLPNTWFTFALPVVLGDQRSLALASGVTRDTSATVAAGILPAAGLDANDPTVGTTGSTMFRGVSRGGLDALYVGLGVAPMGQDRDDTKPTWKIGATIGIPVGEVARFDRAAPSRNTAIGRGIYDVEVWTTFTKRTRRAVPYARFDWRIPVKSQSASLFSNPGFGATNILPAQRAGMRGGASARVVDRAADAVYVDIGFEGRSSVFFEGRAYTEMWEAFAYAGDANTENAPLVLDRDPTVAGVQAFAHPGISNVENHLELGGKFTVAARLGQRVWLNFGVDVFSRTAHAISFADAGVDLPQCAANMTAGCESAVNDVVNPNSAEVNPLHNQRIDLVGHRYLVDGQLGITASLMATARF